MNLQKRFLDYISNKRLVNKNEKILLAVSGGVDSVVMLDLFAKLGFKIAIAHCNFLLRNENSDLDEKFATNLAFEYNIKLFTKHCDAAVFAKKNKISVEMAARQLRYSWFNEIANKQNYSKIATAHHLNDSVETILLNLSKKTGLKGLTGIPVKNKNIIRPLLFASKQEILDYSKKNNLTYRTDHTNFENDYQRNKIRNIIIPEFEKITPAFSQNVAQTSEYLSQYYQLFEYRMKKFKDFCIFYSNFSVKIKIKKMFEFKPIDLFLFEFLRNYGFNSAQVKGVLASLNSVGKQFFAEKNRLVIDRDEIIITNQFEEEKKKSYIVEITDENININNFQVDALNLSKKVVNIEDMKLIKNSDFAFLDFDKLQFPLKLRKWNVGDSFFPYGMKSKKKLSKYFTDKKFSLIDKENTWLLTSKDDIIWVVGHRIDNRYRINSQTKKVVVFKIL